MPPLPRRAAGPIWLRGTRRDFDPQRSDIDLLVTYAPQAAPTSSEYFDLSEQLAELLARPIDLVMPGAVRNPFLRAGIERSKELLYAA